MRVEPEQMRQPDSLPGFCRVHRNGRPLIGKIAIRHGALSAATYVLQDGPVRRRLG